jgi:predicted metal-dependent hydrolase
LTEQIIISGISIDVIRKNIKNIHLAVYPPTGRVRIAAPIGTSDDAIRLFTLTKFGWIKRHQLNFNQQKRIPAREYKQRESHYFLGQRYLLNIVDTDGPSRVIVKSKRTLELYIQPGASTEKKHEVLTEWYRKQLKLLIPPLVQKWERVLNLMVSEVRIKQMKTHWGTCNIPAKRIWLNLELAKKPEQCLEYILVHEMIHLLERHHNQRFILLINRFLPNWEKLKKELNRLPVSHANWEY